MTASEKHLADRVRKLAGDVAGGVGGAAVGLLLGGPTGAVAGAASGPLLAEAARKVFGDIASRFLSSREEIRIANAAFHATSEIAKRLERGEQLRQDDFFNPDESGRSDAEEVFEGVLVKCKNEHQEKKAPFLGYLFANVAFSSVSASNANAILKLAERMSYRQFCILALCFQEDEFGFDSMQFVRLRSHPSGDEAAFLLTDWRELRSESIAVIEPEKSVEGPKIRPTSVGTAAYELLGLSKIPRAEIQELVDLVKQSTR